MAEDKDSRESRWALHARLDDEGNQAFIDDFPGEEMRSAAAAEAIGRVIAIHGAHLPLDAREAALDDAHAWVMSRQSLSRAVRAALRAAEADEKAAAPAAADVHARPDGKAAPLDWPADDFDDPTDGEEPSFRSTRTLADAELLSALLDGDQPSLEGSLSKVRRPPLEKLTPEQLGDARAIVRGLLVAVRYGTAREWHAIARAREALESDELRYVAASEVVRRLIRSLITIAEHKDRLPDHESMVTNHLRTARDQLTALDSRYSSITDADLRSVAMEASPDEGVGGKGKKGIAWAFATLTAKCSAFDCTKHDTAITRFRTHVGKQAKRDKETGT